MRIDAPEESRGQRLDAWLAAQLPMYSRARIQEWIKAGRVLVNGKPAKRAHELRGGETIDLEPLAPPPLRAEPEAIPLDILYEDDAVIAVNKPAGMTVHAGAGVHRGTLTNALLHRFGALSSLNGELRPGIVHRLDRFTSGVLLVARHDEAHRALAAQFAHREVEKTYLALVEGRVAGEQGRIEHPIGRHHIHRLRMTTTPAGRNAITEWRVRERWARHTLLEVRILTGRTHQIRVHLASLRHPVAGDTLYGAAPAEKGRFFLHAWRLVFTNPASGERQTIEAPLPAELADWLAEL